MNMSEEFQAWEVNINNTYVWNDNFLVVTIMYNNNLVVLVHISAYDSYSRAVLSHTENVSWNEKKHTKQQHANF